MSTTNSTGSSLPMPSWALPCSPKASSGGAATATRLPIVWPSIASVSAGVMSEPTVSSSGLASLPKVE